MRQKGYRDTWYKSLLRVFLISEEGNLPVRESQPVSVGEERRSLKMSVDVRGIEEDINTSRKGNFLGEAANSKSDKNS